MKKTIALISALLISTVVGARQSVLLHDLNLVKAIKNSVDQSLQAIEYQSCSQEDLQKLRNIFLMAFQYAQLDLECTLLRQKLFKKVLKLKFTPENAAILTSIQKIAQTLALMEEKSIKAASCWHHIQTYLDQPEQAEVASLVSLIANHRLLLFNDLAKSFNKHLTTLINQTYSANAGFLTTGNMHNNSLLSIAKKQFLINYDEAFVELKELESAKDCVSNVGKEALKIVFSCKAINTHYCDFLVLNAVVDMLYYNTLQEFVNEKYTDNVYNTVLFNENGLIPEQERREVLPHVIN